MESRSYEKLMCPQHFSFSGNLLQCLPLVDGVRFCKTSLILLTEVELNKVSKND